MAQPQPQHKFPQCGAERKTLNTYQKFRDSVLLLEVCIRKGKYFHKHLIAVTNVSSVSCVIFAEMMIGNRKKLDRGIGKLTEV